MNNRTYTLHFDGSAKPNPGQMTSGYVIADDDGKVAFSETIEGGDGTNNLAEYIGLWRGIIKAVKSGIKHIKIFGDSELVIKQVRGEYKCKIPDLKYYRDMIQNNLENFYTYKITHISRKYNKEADRLTK